MTKARLFRPRPMYREKDNWILALCQECEAFNYVEPHGTTAHCEKCKADREHLPIPWEYRDPSGCYLMHKPSKLGLESLERVKRCRE